MPLASGSMPTHDLDALAALVGAGGAVVLSGAGLSTDSGTLSRTKPKCRSEQVQQLRGPRSKGARQALGQRRVGTGVRQ